MRKIKELILIILLLLPASLIAQTSYYVSSSEGNDSNSGTSSSQPWQSLAKVNSFKPGPGDNILFNRGDEWKGTLTITASGSSGNPVVYGAYGSGAKPKIYSSEFVTEWSLHSGSIYKATFNTDIEQLFVDGVRMKLARTPNTGYYNVSSSSGGTSVTSTDLNGGIDYAGASFLCRVTQWNIYSQTVSSSSSQTLTLASSMSSIGANEGFWLSNKLRFLDQAGEWYYDPSTNTVYLWAPNSDSPSGHTVRGSTLDYGINVNAKNYITIRDLEIQHSATNGINADNSDYLTIDNCIISYPEQYGVYIPETGSTNTIINNTSINGANRAGIHSWSPNSTFSNNTVTNIALQENFHKKAGDYLGMGIYTKGNYCTVDYNRITNTAYSGISFYGTNNEVKYNFIDNAMAVLGDGGAIYTYNGAGYSYAGSANSEIMYNIILNAKGNTDGSNADFPNGYGIYMDDYTHDINIRYNTVSNCNCGIYLHNGGAIDVMYNDISDCEAMLLTGGQSGTINYKYNTLYAYDEIGSFIWQKNRPQKFLQQEAASPTFDYNTYVGHYNDQNIFKDSWEWDAWLRDGNDSHSTFDSSPLSTGETEKLFYNDTKQSKTFSLGSSIYRDLNGKEIKGSLTLEPFTSKILIKTTLTNTSGLNHLPTLQDQSFDIIQDKAINDFIGQVVASDPDAGQTLTYSIVQGNDANLFSIDPTTGIIKANAPIQANIDQSILLSVLATDDDASSPLSADATITINIKNIIVVDATLPVVFSFDIPSSSSTLTVPILTFVATDDNSVDGYILTETSTAPLSSNNGWSLSVPTDYTFSQTGNQNLYAWVKDAAGNVSKPIYSSVTITLPKASSDFSEYLFEETPGATVVDTQGSNDGTIINEESRINGVNGKGLEFTGSGFVSLGQSFGDNVQDELTLSAWIMPNPNSSGYQGIIMHGGPNTDTYALYLHPDFKRIGFKTSGTSSSWVSIDNVDSLWDGNWHMLTVTYDGTKKIIYLDGVVLLSVDAAGLLESGQGYNLVIGAGRDEVNPSLLYQGLIDEVRISNTALTSSEINNLYQLANTNQSPIIQDQSFEIIEDKATNDMIGQIGATDPDLDQTLTYSIAQGNDVNIFKIDPATGAIRANSPIRVVDNKTYILIIKVTDNGTIPLSAFASIKINVLGQQVNQSPIIQDQSFEILERKRPSDFIGQVIASDPDQGQSLTYSISQGNESGLFAINSSSGEITANTTISNNTDQSYILIVKATDNATNPFSASASVTIRIVAKTKPIKGEVNNGKKKTVVIYYSKTLQVNSTPLPSDFSFSGDKTVTNIEIVGSELHLKIDSEFKYGDDIIVNYSKGLEPIIDANGYETVDSYSLTVKNNIAQIVDNTKPIVLNGILEDSSRDRITIHLSEPLNSNYVPNNSDFEISNNKVNSVTISGSDILLDLDSEYEYGDVINVSYQKGENPICDLALNELDAFTGFSIDNNIINNPPQIEDQVIDIEEVLSSGQFVGQVVASDPDEYQTLNYSIISGNDEGFFRINKTNGIIYANTAIHVSEDQIIDLVIQVADNTDTPLNATAEITINLFSNATKEVEVPTGISEDQITNVSVYPNPTSGIITIKAYNLEFCDFYLFNMTGQQVMRKQLSNIGGNLEEEFNLSYLRKGTYIVRLVSESDAQIYQSKIIII